MIQLPSHVEASRIASRLYQGSKPAKGPALAFAGFQVLVLTAEEHQPSAVHFPGVEVLYVPLDDGNLSSDELTRAIAGAGAIARRVSDGRRVLVTCAQGRNRSGLVVALVLQVLTGCSGRRAALTVQANRRSPFGPALSNPSFTQMLSAIPRWK